MDEERWIRPNARVMDACVASIFAFMYGHLGLLTAFAWIWWPAHHILDNTAAEWFWGTALLASILAAPVLAYWFWCRRSAWHVGPAGIAIRRGRRPARVIPWPDVREVVVLFHYAVVRTRTRPGVAGYELPFLTRDDERWLRAFVRGRVGGPPPRPADPP